MTNLRLDPQEQESGCAPCAITSAWSNRLVLAVLALFLAPVVEEIFFSRDALSGHQQAGFPRLATWGVSRCLPHPF